MNKLTIIVPHFDDMKHLKRLLTTIPKTKISVLVVDNTPGLSLSDFDHLKNEYPQVKFLKSCESSAGLARNIGIENASTEWLIFADSDDLFSPDFFHIVARYFDSDSDIIYFSPIFHTDTANSKDYRMNYARMIDSYFDNPTKEKEWKIRLTFDVPWSKMMRRQFILEKNLVFENKMKQNDTMFAQKAGIFAKKVIISNEVIYCAIDNADSITHQIEKPYFEDALDVKIRSYHLKMNSVNKKFLKKSNELIFIEPVKTVIKALQIYGELPYTYEVYRIFQKNNVPVISLTVLRILAVKLIGRIAFNVKKKAREILLKRYRQ